MIKQIIKSVRTKSDIQEKWVFKPDLSFWENQINSYISEKNSGILAKIDQISKIAPVEIIGGLSIGGTDDIFLVENGADLLKNRMQEIEEGKFLLLYIPHIFWIQLFGCQYKWFPDWEEIYNLFENRKDWEIFQYSTSFDLSGRYFFIAKKKKFTPNNSNSLPLSRQTFRVFFHLYGDNTRIGHSSVALSTHLCHALKKTGANIYSYHYSDIESLDQCNTNDIFIGHPGPWVKEAYKKGFERIVLFTPANNWYPTRNNKLFESNSTIEEQVLISKLIISQSGSIWRSKANYPFPEKWRWVDLGVDRSLFPKVKKRYNKVGKRKFCFIHLYDAKQKGNDIAKEIIKARPNYEFTWIGGEKFNARNMKYFNQIPNTSWLFRKIVGMNDFILVPSREDAQPGTLIEATSLGLIPVATYTSGYSLSFPNIVLVNELNTWLEIIDKLQQISEENLQKVSSILDFYLLNIHDWDRIENLILFYLQEFVKNECNIL